MDAVVVGIGVAAAVVGATMAAVVVGTTMAAVVVGITMAAAVVVLVGAGVEMFIASAAVVTTCDILLELVASVVCTITILSSRKIRTWVCGGIDTMNFHFGKNQTHDLNTLWCVTNAVL